MQRDGETPADNAAWPREASGGSVYLRLSTRTLEQVPRTIDPALSTAIIRGGYWLQPPTPSCEVVIAYQGVLASEAIAAAGLLGADKRNIAVLAVTSADRLNAGWHAAQRARQHGDPSATCHVEDLLRTSRAIAASSPLSTVIRQRSAGSAASFGHRAQTLGVEHFGQTGTVNDLYAHFGIDAAAITNAATGFLGRHAR